METSLLAGSWRSLAEYAEPLKQGLLIGAAVLVLVLPPSGRPQRSMAATSSAPASVVAPLPPDYSRSADFGEADPHDEVRTVADWVVQTRDNRGMNFVILDKKNTHVFVFDREGRLQGDSPVLIGALRGDDTIDTVRGKKIADVLPEERTTPAGRFVAEPGRNTLDEDVVWVDYDAAVSMHRVRATEPKERRLERLATPTTEDNRISYGCINVPVAFFEGTLKPAFEAQYGVVYVMPEIKAPQEVFAAAFAPRPGT